MNYYTTIHKETREGFDIVFSTCPEDSPPDFFESKDEEQQFWKDLESGHTAWFIAKVEAYKNGVRLGVDYLGGCWYASEMDFVNESDYYGDMVSVCLASSRALIKSLTEEVTQ